MMSNCHADLITLCKKLAMEEGALADKIMRVRDHIKTYPEKFADSKADVLSMAFDIDSSLLVRQKGDTAPAALALDDFKKQNRPWFELAVLMAVALEAKTIDVVSNSSRTVSIDLDVGLATTSPSHKNAYGSTFDGDPTKPLCTKVVLTEVVAHLKTLVAANLTGTSGASASASDDATAVSIEANHFQIADLDNGFEEGDSADIAWRKAQGEQVDTPTDTTLTKTDQKTAIIVAIAHQQAKKYPGQAIFMLATDDNFTANIINANYFMRFTPKDSVPGEDLPIANLLRTGVTVNFVFYRARTAFSSDSTYFEMPKNLRGELAALFIEDDYKLYKNEITAVKAKVDAYDGDIDAKWIADNLAHMSEWKTLCTERRHGYVSELTFADFLTKDNTENAKVRDMITRHNTPLLCCVAGKMNQLPAGMDLLELCRIITKADSCARLDLMFEYEKDPIHLKVILFVLNQAIFNHKFILPALTGEVAPSNTASAVQNSKYISGTAHRILGLIQPYLEDYARYDVNLTQELKDIKQLLDEALGSKGYGWGTGLFRFQPQATSTRDLYRSLIKLLDPFVSPTSPEPGKITAPETRA